MAVARASTVRAKVLPRSLNLKAQGHGKYLAGRRPAIPVVNCEENREKPAFVPREAAEAAQARA